MLQRALQDDLRTRFRPTAAAASASSHGAKTKAFRWLRSIELLRLNGRSAPGS